MRYGARFPGDARRGGFTLIELMVAVIVLGLIMAMSTANFTNARENATISQMQSNVHVVQVGLERYADDYKGVYPASIVDSQFQKVYLPTRHLPAAPWCTRSQTAAIGFTSPGPLTSTEWDNVVSAAALHLVPTDTDSPGAATMADPPAAKTDYGAIAYEYSSTTGIYRLAGYAKDHGHRAVVTPVSNNAQGANAVPN